MNEANTVERPVGLRAWAIFVDSGNVRMWTTFQPHIQKLADAEGLAVTPLYDQTAIDAAVAAERGRCACALRAAREGYASEEITGLPVVPQWRERTLAMIDAALQPNAEMRSACVPLDCPVIGLTTGDTK